jgi:hypothetical protein
MSLRYKFKNADRICHQLNNDGRRRLAEICTEIQKAEKNLNQNALDKLSGCYKECQGLCCRNVIPDDLITQMDALYIWEQKPSLRKRINICLKSESIYSADCFFLKDGVGPCIFPADIRPEKCITAFCGDTGSIKKEIRDLRGKFNQMFWFVFFKKLHMFSSFCQRAIGLHSLRSE